MIRIENLKKTYDRGRRHENEVLHGVSLNLPDTGFICILGPSGCGKTSLLNAIGGLDSFDSGLIATDDLEIRRSGSREMEELRNSSFGYIFQNYYLLGEHSVAYNVYLGLYSLDVSEKEKYKLVRDALKRVDMLRYLKRPVAELSGGQQQRVAIARAIARRPRVIFADEPTGNLDEDNTMNICSILKELSKESLVVMVTHETRIAKFFADRIINIQDGSIMSVDTDWERNSMDAGERDAIYSGDYNEEQIDAQGVSLRILRREGADDLNITVAIENERIVIKTNDPRIILSSEIKLVEGDRPVLHAESRSESVPPKTGDKRPPTTDKKHFMGLSALFREAKGLSSSRKIKSFGIGLFIIVLSLMLVMTAMDVVTIISVDPEKVCSSDPRVLELSTSAGNKIVGSGFGGEVLASDMLPYRIALMNHIRECEYNAYLVPYISATLVYTGETFVQLERASIRFDGAVYANREILQEDSLIAGRMPERYDEIIVDRWLIDKQLESEGILQNIIPDASFFVDKEIYYGMGVTFKIVGISDAGGPTIYVSDEGLMSLCKSGASVISLSEYKRITGNNDLPELLDGECINMSDGIMSGTNGYTVMLKCAKQLTVKDTIKTTAGILAKYIVADSYIDDLYEATLLANSGISVISNEKAALREYLEGGLPEELDGYLNIEIQDHYTDELEGHISLIMESARPRLIISLTVTLAAVIMLYFMQRSKMRERMDLVSVYRLLGIPKRNLVAIFSIESLIETFKFALPSVLLPYIAVRILDTTELSTGIVFPLWAAVLTLAVIAVFRVIVVTIPLLRLTAYPPAKLAAKYDI